MSKLHAIRLYNKQAERTNPFNDWVILAGKEAYKAYYGEKSDANPNGAGNGDLWQFIQIKYSLPSETTPCLLDASELPNIVGLRLAPEEQRFIKVFEVGEIPTITNGGDDFQTRVLMNLAENNPNIQTLVWVDKNHSETNLTDELNRIKEGKSDMVEILNKIAPNRPLADEDNNAGFTALFREMGDNEKLAEFLKWYEKPLRINDLSKAIYHYTGKKWEIVEDSQIGRSILAFFKAKGVSRYSANSIKNLLELLKYESEPMGKADPHLLAFANGVLHKQTGDFMPHDERHFLTSFINIDYYSTQTATPNFDKWLNWVSDSNGEKKQRILAALYMILTNRHEWQLFLEITGAGGTGKSVFNHLARILAGGDDNTASISLKDLENPTMRCGLIDKTLCYSPDQESYISDGGILRSITGGDSISFRPLYRGAFQDTVKAVFLITGNSPIIFKEQKGGTSRRRVIFQFNKVVREEEKDFELSQKLEQEAGGIVRLLLDTFPDPMVAKQLLEAQKHSEEALEVKEENDHILQFTKHFEAREIINGLTLGSSRRTDAHRTALHSAYLYYCERMGIPNPLQRNRFRQAFEYALKERGSKQPLRTRIKDGTNVTNIYYINIAHSLNEWND